MLVRFRCLGSAARWTGAVVFERDEDEWQILHVRFGSKALGVGDFRSPIGQVHAEPITGHDQHADIHLATINRGAKVNEVNDDKVTATGSLNLNPDAYARAIDDPAFCPIDVTTNFLLPSTCLFKALIEQLPHDSAAVGITFFFHEKLKAGQD